MLDLDLLDLWTLAHLSAGLLLGLARRRLATACAAAFAWEWVEAALQATWDGAADFGVGDPRWLNGVVDVAAVLLGWFIARHYADRILGPVDDAAKRAGW